MRVEESQEDRVRGLITSNQISDGETTEWARNPIQRDNGCELFKLHESHKPSQQYLHRINKQKVTLKHIIVKIKNTKDKEKI